MKNKLLIAVSSLLLAVSLSSCDFIKGLIGSEGSESEESEVISSEESESTPASSEEETGWTAAELAIMDNHLHGVRLPYPGVRGTLEYLDSYNRVMFMSESGEYKNPVAAEYANLYKEEDGWTDRSEGTIYMFTKTKTVEDNVYDINVTFAILDEGGSPVEGEGVGYLYIIAESPLVDE